MNRPLSANVTALNALPAAPPLYREKNNENLRFSG
jgi:hypothetical protein